MQEELRALRERVEALEKEVTLLKETRVERGSDAPEASAPPSDPAPPSWTPHGETQAPDHHTPAHHTPAQPPTPAYQPPPLSPSVPSGPPRPTGRAGIDVESQVAGIWFNRIAVVLLVLAAVYGFKWAIDNEYLGPVARIALGYLAALLTLAAGRHSHTRGYRAWSLGVTGAGVALLYITTYAAYQLYALIPFSPAFGLMLLATLCGAALAIYYDAVPIAWLGALGGFLTPFLLYTGQSNAPGLYTYVALLALGILSLTWFRNWPSLSGLGLVATWIIFGVGTEDFNVGQWTTWFAFASLFWAIFASAGLLSNVVRRRPASGWDLGLISLNSLVYFSVGLGLLERVPAAQDAMGLFALAVAVAHGGLAYLVHRRHRADTLLPMYCLGLGILFLIVAVPVQWEGAWVSMAWAMQGIVLVALGRRVEHVGLNWAGLAVLGLAVLATLVQSGQGRVWDPQLVDILLRSLSFAVTIAALWCGAWLVGQWPERGAGAARGQAHPPALMQRDRWVAAVAVVATLLTLYWVSSEIAYHFDRLRVTIGGDFSSQSDFAVSAIWALYGLVMMVSGFVWRWRGGRLLAIGVLGLTIYKVATNDIWYLEEGWRVIGLFAVGLVLLAASYLYFRYKDRLVADGDEQHTQPRR